MTVFPEHAYNRNSDAYYLTNSNMYTDDIYRFYRLYTKKKNIF